MSNHTHLLKMLGLLVGCFYTFIACASPIEDKADQYIQLLYHNLNSKKNLNLNDRIVWISEQFLNKPYLLGALGEGDKARFDQFPRYRVDAFDCETYVDTVLALALADNLQDFKEKILKIRYKAGKVAYTQRNHFTDLDWNLNNQAQGFVKDITPDFKGVDVKMAEADINKPGWYVKLPPGSIRLQKSNTEESKTRLDELHNKAALFSVQKATIPYIPFSSIFNAKGDVNTSFFEQIPQAAIIEIIRPNWDLVESSGSHLNVSHLGFAIWKNHKLYFRQASSRAEFNRVVDLPLDKYLLEATKSPTIKGINLQIALPGKS